MIASPYGSEVRLLLRAALLLFTFTVVVGILNGVDVVDFDRKTLLTHVHAGALGWITMSVIAATLWLFALGDRAPSGRSLASIIAIATPVTVTAYALAFLFTTGILRPIIGATVLLVIVVASGWTFGQVRGRTLSVPHVAILAALLMSIAGAVLGVLFGLRLANGSTIVPASAADAHPAAMVVGFLVPVGMAFIEWIVDPASITRRASIAGWVQVVLPFLGGVLAMVGLLASIPALITVGLPFEVIGLVILVVRLRGPLLAGFQVTSVASGRHGTMALLFLIVNIALLVYLVVNYFSINQPPPLNLLLALDHSIFVGVMTNCILGLITLFRLPVAPVIDHLVFAGLNLGIMGFVIGLLLDSTPFKHSSTPVLGLAILLALATSFGPLGKSEEA